MSQNNCKIFLILILINAYKIVNENLFSLLIFYKNS